MDEDVEPTTGDSGRQPGDFVAVTVLWLLWALSVVPVVGLFLEFDDPLPACVGASYYAKLYGHIFVYPATFGLLATAFLTQPWLHTVRSIRRLASPQRGRVVAFLLCAIVGIISFASWADFTRATPALWSFEAAAKQENAGVIRNACEVLLARSQSPGQPPAKLDKEREGASRQQNDQQDTKPLDTLKCLPLDRSRSYTEWAYYVGFIANTTWIALLFGVVVARVGANDQSQLGHTITAMGLATAWIPFRFAFLAEKAELYNDPLLPLNYLIFLAFVVLYLHILRLHVREPEGKAWGVWNFVVLIGNVIVVILTSLAAVVGPLAEWVGGRGGEILVRYFGSESSLLVYITMLLLFLVMVAPATVRRLWGTEDR